MSKVTAGFDRFIVFLVGLLLLAAGVFGLLWVFGLSFATTLFDKLSRNKVHDTTTADWWPWVLIATIAVSVIFGLWILIANLRMNRYNNSDTGRSSEDGRVRVHVTDVADAVADRLKRVDDIHHVGVRTRFDRGQRTVQWLLRGRPTVQMDILTKAIEEAEKDFRAALPGMDVDTRFLVHLDPVQQ